MASMPYDMRRFFRLTGRCGKIGRPGGLHDGGNDRSMSLPPGEFNKDHETQLTPAEASDGTERLKRWSKVYSLAFGGRSARWRKAPGVQPPAVSLSI